MQKNIKIVPILLTLIPGMGHLWEGKDLKGLVLFSSFAVGAAGILEGMVLWAGEWGGVIALCSFGWTCLVFGYALIDIFRFTYGPWRQKIELKRKKHLHAGILSFLKSDYEIAEQEFQENLRLMAGDPESLFRLAVISRRRGEIGRARRYLKIAGKNDLCGKWSWECSREEEFLHGMEHEYKKTKKRTAEEEKEAVEV